MIEGYPTTAMRLVPRDAVSVVGTFSLREGRIMLTGPSSERAVAEWLGALRFDPPRLWATSAAVPITNLDKISPLTLRRLVYKLLTWLLG